MSETVPPSQLTIFSVDPGPVNTGWVFGSFVPSTGVLTLIDGGVSRLVDESGDWDEASIASGVWRFVNVDQARYLKDVSQVLLEFQFPMWDKPNVYSYVKNRLVEISIKSHFPPDRVRSLPPSQVKNRYKLATGSHDENKKLVPLWVLKNFGQEIYREFIVSRLAPTLRHHVCDALCQLIYWIEISNKWPIKTIKYGESLHVSWKNGQELHSREQGPPQPNPPPNDHDVNDQGNGRDKPKTARKRTIHPILSIGSSSEGKKSRRQNPWKP